MRKALFTGLAVVSLLFCIATLVLWVRSYWVIDGVMKNDGTALVRVNSMQGYIVSFREKSPTSAPSFKFRAGEPLFGGTHLHFYFDMSSQWYFVIPDWLIALIAAIPAFSWLVLFRFQNRRRIYRLKNHQCLSCGYDLRASTDRCPECGTPIASAVASPKERSIS